MSSDTKPLPRRAARPLTAKDTANSINYAVGTCGPNSDGACYAPHGALASVKLGGTITSAYTFNNRLLYATIKGTVSTTNVLDLAYGYFANGNVSAITNNLNTSRTQTFTYDNQNRLGTAQSQATSGSDCWGQSCGYDANNWNNLVSITVTKCTAPGLSVSVNSQNRITNSGFTYNASGDMTADGIGGLSFTWNAEERLTAAGGVTYTYDGDGWRVKKSNGIIHWRSLSGEILAETDLAGNNLREYIYFAGRRVARRDANGTVYYFLQDHLGSTRIIANASGGVVRDVDYYPHGTEKLVSGTVDDPHKFAGMYFDSESGLYYTWFRMYSPSLGRWLAPDPIAGDVETPGSLNRYTYVLNNPVNLVDPLGLDPTCTVTIIDNDQLLTSQQLAEAQLEIINIFKQAGIGVMFNQNNPDFTVNLVPQPKFWQAGVPPDALARNDAFFQGLFGLASSATAFTERIANEVGANIGPAVGRVVAHEFGHFALQLVHKKWNPDELEVGIMAQGLNWLFSGQNFDPQAHVPRLKQVCEERSAARTGQAGGGRGGGPSGVPTGGRGGGGSAGAGVIVPVYAPGEGGGWVLSGYWLYPNSPPPGPRRR